MPNEPLSPAPASAAATRRFALVALALGALAAFPGESSAQAEHHAGWEHVEPGGETGCAHGTDWSFWFRAASLDEVVIYFQGGGACWFGEICALDRRPTYDPTVDASDAPEAAGIFDFANPENPFAGWSVLFVPYCTADLHLGAATVEYDLSATDAQAASTLKVRHQGNRNVDAALAFLRERVADPGRVFVTGVSAGSLAAAFHSYPIARMYPRADIAQLGDAAGSYRAPSVPAILRSWGNHELRPPLPEYADPETDFETFYKATLRNAPNVRMARLNYNADETQLFFLGLLGVSGVPLLELLDANDAEILEAAPSYRSYVVSGTAHGIIREDAFYTMSSDGVRLRDWVAELASGNAPASVRCEACR